VDNRKAAVTLRTQTARLVVVRNLRLVEMQIRLALSGAQWNASQAYRLCSTDISGVADCFEIAEDDNPMRDS
jgi:hypothetical protein